MPPLNSPVSRAQRDDRLDLLRGLCLLNMVLVHLIERGLHVPWVAHEVLMNWFRFAAGGFIFTSGLCIGAIFYKRSLDPAKRWKAYRSILLRAGVVLLVHYFSTFLSLLPDLAVVRQVQDAPKLVGDVLHLWTGYDLLLFYVVMLAISPVLIEIVRRFGVWPVLVLTIGAFFVRPDDPYLRFYPLENDFPILRWQLMFVLGVLAGARLPKFDALSAATKQKLAIVGLAAATGVALLSALEREMGWTFAWWAAVWKVPLTPLEAVRYIGLVLALGVFVDRFAKAIVPTRGGQAVVLVGSCSLLLWVAHVPIVANLTGLAWPVAIVLAFVGVWSVAKISQALNRAWANSFESLPRLATLTPVLGSLAVMALLFEVQARPRYASPLPVPVRPAPAMLEPIQTLDQGFVSLGDDESDEPSLETPIPVDEDSLFDQA